MTRRFRAAALLLAAATAAVVAGCSTVRPAGSTGRREDPNKPDATLVQMIQCFRAHGLPNFPDPVYDPNDGRWHLPNERPDITADVRQACASVMPHVTPASPIPSAQLHDLLQYAQCLRAHGVRPRVPVPPSTLDCHDPAGDRRRPHRGTAEPAVPSRPGARHRGGR